MGETRYFWAIVPSIGLMELAAHYYFSNRTPSLAHFEAANAAVAELKQTNIPVVVAPDWAQPLARQAWGDALFPIAELARPESAIFQQAIEVSLLGERARETRAWRTVSSTAVGPLQIRLLQNPDFIPTQYQFLDHISPSELEVYEVHADHDRPCVWNASAPGRTGGLGGPPAYPHGRFLCKSGEAYFVGITIIDDQDYRPRRCLYAQPPPGGILRLRFPNVPIGHKIRGYAGLPYLIHRDGKRAPVELSVAIEGRIIGSYTHQEEWGFRRFELYIPGRAEGTALMEFEVRSDSAERREFCFVAYIL